MPGLRCVGQEWEAQRPLADRGYQLVVPTRRGYPPRSGGVGEDFLLDGEDVAALLGDGAHLVGHSYGGLAAIVAAATRPEAVYSLVLAEAPTFGVAAEHPEVARLRDRLEAEHRVAEGAGHEVQMAAGSFNALLLSVWRHARTA